MRLGCILIAAGLLVACGQERAEAPAETPAPATTEVTSDLDSALEAEPAAPPVDDINYQALSG